MAMAPRPSRSRAPCCSSQLLKRFESSLEAFRRTLGKMIGSHERFLEILDRGYVAVPRVSPEAFDAGLDDDDLDLLLADDPNARPTGEYLVRRASREGRRGPRSACGPCSLVPPRSTRSTTRSSTRCSTRSRGSTAAATHADERKVVLFSYFADTIDYLHGFLDDHGRSADGSLPRPDRRHDRSGQF